MLLLLAKVGVCVSVLECNTCTSTGVGIPTYRELERLWLQHHLPEVLIAVYAGSFPLSTCKFPHHEALCCRQCRVPNAQMCDSAYRKDKGEDRAFPPRPSLLSVCPCSKVSPQHPLPPSSYHVCMGRVSQASTAVSWQGMLSDFLLCGPPASLVLKGWICEPHCCSLHESCIN